MKHHFVPEVYLKQFSRNCEGHFFKVKRGQKRAKKIHTSGVCYREDFYDIKNPTALHEHKLTEKSFLERYGFPYERGWINLIENFKSRQYVSRSQHEQLLKAYVSIKQRTHFFRRQFTDQKLLNRIFNEVTSKMYEEYKTLIDQRKVDFESIKSEQLEKMQDTSTFSEENHLRGLVESLVGINTPIHDALLKLLSMNFEVLTPKVDKDFFLT
ncbi:MAG TPA: DUF4238 domain-containing protein, partial [Cyclobacteriaceae bacterium]|nr:DUF4238 domain-containing protein [Cyclobacteriaceae bacterium]